VQLAEVVEIFVPAHRDFGWIRAQVRGSIVTFKLRSEALEDMVNRVVATPEDRPVIDPMATPRSSRYATRWPPVAKASTWLLREPAGRRTRWRSLSTA
jgi:hypothetical protein